MFGKKLELKKESVRVLVASELADVVGGAGKVSSANPHAGGGKVSSAKPNGPAVHKYSSVKPGGGGHIQPTATAVSSARKPQGGKFRPTATAVSSAKPSKF